jgi:response regulator NasT
VVLVTGPASAGALMPGRIAGVARFRELGRLRRVLADRPVVEAAKARLMARDGLSEAAAFGWLRRGAMERQMRMGEVARTVPGGEGRTTWHAGS